MSDEKLKVRVLTPEEVAELAKLGREIAASFQEQARDVVTPERAAFVRKLRVDDGGTWRWVAERCHDAWTDCAWDPPSNQLMGMALCERAAELFGEDYMQEPWN